MLRNKPGVIVDQLAVTDSSELSGRPSGMNDPSDQIMACAEWKIYACAYRLHPGQSLQALDRARGKIRRVVDLLCISRPATKGMQSGRAPD